MTNKILKWAILQKYRFDLSYYFIGMINFVLLIVALSDKIKANLGIEMDTMILAGVVVFIAFFGIWLFGYTLDKIKYPHIKTGIESSRNPYMTEILERIKHIEEKLEKP